MKYCVTTSSDPIIIKLDHCSIYRVIAAILSYHNLYSYHTLAKIAVLVSIEATTRATIEIAVELRTAEHRLAIDSVDGILRG
jgi:hypothetical protein